MASDDFVHADNPVPVTPSPVQPEAAKAAPSDDVAAAAASKTGPLVAARLEGGDVQANLSAVGSLQAGSLTATGSAIGAASVDGDATVTASFVPALISRGNTTVQQSYASAVIAGGESTTIRQAGAPLIIGKTLDVTQSGGVVLLSGESDIKQSWVGVVLAPKVTISDDSRVLISTKAALIIAFAILGGFGIIAVVAWLGVRRLMSWRPTIRIPGLPDVAKRFPGWAKALPEFQRSLPDLATIQERMHAIQQMRKAS